MAEASAVPKVIVCVLPERQRLDCLRLGLGLKNGPRSAGASTVSVGFGQGKGGAYAPMQETTSTRAISTGELPGVPRTCHMQRELAVSYGHLRARIS